MTALARAMRRAERPRLILALLLAAPLALFLFVNFLAPLLFMLSRAVTEREAPRALPETARMMRAWDGAALPEAALVATFRRELASARRDGALGAAANRLNHDLPGARSMVMAASTLGPAAADEDPLDALAALDSRWRELSIWAALKRAAGPFTGFHLLAALDLRAGADGMIMRAPPDRAIFVQVLLRTLYISAIVALLCLMLGYPVAYLLAVLPERWSNPLLLLVLLPFWTSILVRTTAWAVLLQRHGVVNETLMAIGLSSSPFELIYNRAGVLIAMTHVLLPFMILPLYGVMKGVSGDATRAALSLGASPVSAFLRVYFPQTLPGVSAGMVIVFILSLGYYVTPALVGGANDQMIAYFIAYYTNQSLNWGMAAALSLVLLSATFVLVTLYLRLAGGKSLSWR